MLVAGGPAAADVIHLTSGQAIQVDAWRDVGDAIEFARFGGILRILKTDIARIEGATRQQDLRMYSAPATPATGARAAAAPAAPGAVAREMGDLLRQGEALFGQTVLDARDKVGAFRRLRERWQGLEPPEPLRETHARGERALQVATEAYQAEVEGTAPDSKERVDAARKALAEVQTELARAGGGEG
jgi:hypothetical protein